MKHQDVGNGVKQRQTEECEEKKVCTRQRKKCKVHDCRHNHQNGRSPLEKNVLSACENQKYCTKEEVNDVGEDNSIVINDPGMRNEHDMNHGKESISIGERIENINNTSQHGNQGLENLDMVVEEKASKSMEIETLLIKIDGGNSLDASENLKEPCQDRKEKKPSTCNDKDKNDGFITKNVCILQNSIEEKGHVSLPKVNEHERKPSFQRIDKNDNGEQDHTSVKMEDDTMSSLSNSLQILENNTNVMADICSETVSQKKNVLQRDIKNCAGLSELR